MKRRWRRTVLLVLSLLLAMVVVVLSALVWLHASGRLATLAQHLLYRLSGQHITFATIEFPAWNTVVFTNVHLQQQIPGWRLGLDCPRLEARYGVIGLLNKQVHDLRLHHLQIELSASAAPPAAPSAATMAPLPVSALPFQQLRLQDGILRVHWRDQAYTLRQINALFHSQGHGQVRGEVQANLEDTTATLKVVTEVSLGAAAPTGRLRLTADSLPLPLLTRLFAPTLPADWHITGGSVQVGANLELQEHTLQGTITTNMAQIVAQVHGTVLQHASLTSEARLKADVTQRSLHIDAQSRLHAARLYKPADVTMTDIAVTGPWQLSYTPEQWHLTATSTLLGQAVEIGTSVRAERLSLTTLVQVQSQADGLHMQATPDFTVQTVRLHAAGQTDPTLHIAAVQGQLSLHGSPLAMEFRKAHLQTQAWQGAAVPLLTAMTLEGAGSLDLQRQKLTVAQLTGTLPPFGSLHGSGGWHWASHSLHDLRIQLTASDIPPLQDSLRALLPEAAQAWQTAGQFDIQLHATRLSLQPPRQVQGLTVTWQVHDGAFSTAESTYASEHLNGTLQAAVTVDEAAGQYTLQGTLTVQPFGLLIGNLFPALEANNLTSVVTFSLSYSARTDALQLYVAGQFHDLGMLTLRGAIQQLLHTPRADLQLHVRQIDLARLWRIFVHDALVFPTLSQAQVQGTINANLAIRHQHTALLLHGTADVAQGQFQTATLGLQGLSLLLPLQLQYPLPQTAPEATTLPAESFGRLRIATLQMGSVDLQDLSLKLAVWSDNIFVREALSIPLLGGQIAIDHITAQHLLQPHRQLTLPLRLRHIDLQRLQRDAAKLPIAGILDADLLPLHIRGDRLETHGALTVQVAGGVIRIFDLHGSEVWSALPTFGCSLTTETPLSLRRVTDIYPIGDMGGSLHFALTDLTLTAGEPATFVLEFAVQERGGEDREITVRALNNLLFTTGSAKVASGVFGDTYRLPYRRFGAAITLRHDILHLRGNYHDSDGNEYFMQAPPLGGGVSIVNRVPNNGISFRDFLRRLKATVLEKPEVRVQ